MPSVLDASALTTLDDLKNAVGVSTSDTSKDNYLERCINRATLWVEAATNRKLKARNYNGKGSAFSGAGSITSEDYIYFDGTTKERGGQTVVNARFLGEFYLPAYPIQPTTVSGALTFVLAVLTSRDSSGDTWDTTSYVQNEQYIVDYDNGMVKLLGGVFAPGTKNYRITCTAGYVGSAQPHVPADLEGLCIDFARGLYQDSRQLTSESIGTWSRSYSKSMEDPFVQDLLAKYSRTIL